MEEEKVKHELSIIEAWNDTRKITKDGKITVDEFPNLLTNCLVMFKFISKFLVFFKVDPKITLIITSINLVIENLLRNINEHKDEIASIWEQIDEIFDDKKLNEEEIKDLLICIAQLFSILAKISLPFIDNKIINDFDKIHKKILQYVEIIKIST